MLYISCINITFVALPYIRVDLLRESSVLDSMDKIIIHRIDNRFALRAHIILLSVRDLK